ncbi:MAG TPA: LysE family translocator, partial [Parvularculaceae bacterium]|nr:LysE family translocator [Parvularculaceae bacterium]
WLAALLAASQIAFTIIRVAGGCYLLYLAMRTLFALDAAPESKGAGSILGAFRSGCMTNLFNPKVGLFFLAFLPSFVTPAAGPVWLQTFALGAIFSVSGVCVLAIVAFASGAIRDRISRSRRLRITLNGVAAGVFGALGLRILVSRS